MYLLHHETNRASCDKSLIDQDGQSNDRPRARIFLYLSVNVLKRKCYARLSAAPVH
jgi:hypothetical protein